ncbi:hypothetical protein J5X75_25730 [Actinoplanes sp. NEAU-H7]|uniref:Phosphotransferase enzyme family protein n=1 Tax=Actinoplanes flavus TaxID=2820290 RepID=A0ABS3UQ63_9ACTN|nr:hypothetical protein [Actinoplanes flavus]
MLAELAQDHVPGLCHGDASSGNVISSGMHGWMYIDPRGMSGEYAYDAAVMAIRIAAVPSSIDIANFVAEAVQVPESRLRDWMAVAHAARV